MTKGGPWAALVVQALVQHEAAFGLHRAAEVDGGLGQVLAVQREVHLLEQVLQLDVDRPVDDQANGAVIVVFAQQRDGARKMFILHRRHGDQELVLEVAGCEGFHGG